MKTATRTLVNSTSLLDESLERAADVRGTADLSDGVRIATFARAWSHAEPVSAYARLRFSQRGVRQDPNSWSRLLSPWICPALLRHSTHLWLPLFDFPDEFVDSSSLVLLLRKIAICSHRIFDELLIHHHPGIDGSENTIRGLPTVEFAPVSRLTAYDTNDLYGVMRLSCFY